MILKNVYTLIISLTVLVLFTTTTWAVDLTHQEPSLPDLTVSQITCTNGDLSIRVENKGSGPVEIGVDGGLYIWIDGTLEWTYNWSTWTCQQFRKPGGFCIIQPQVLSDGTHDIKACIDANEEVDESDETNNCFKVSLSCGDDTTDPGDTDDPSDDPVNPAGSNCVTAGDYYKTCQSDLAQVDLGRVFLTQAKLANGDPVGLGIQDCNENDLLDITVPWSESTASPKAKIHFSSDICNGNAPASVDVSMQHTFYATLTAYDDNNMVVDTQTATDDQSSVQTLTLTSTTGIRTIEIEGAEICITRICWECRPIDDNPPVDEDKNCVSADDYYKTDQSDLAQVDLGRVYLTQAKLANGDPVGLGIQDCNADDRLDITVPWSESSASSKAKIHFSSDVCNGMAPTSVEVHLQHSFYATLTALDDSGMVVDTCSAADDQTTVQTLTLTSTTGIRTIEIEGAEICITRICWECGQTDDNTPPVEDDGCCATFDFLSGIIHVPCLDLHTGTTYWFDIKIVDFSHPMKFELVDIDMNKN